MAIAETPDNLRLWYEVSGCGPETVLLIAGQAMRGRAWGAVADLLARDRQVIVYDHRGIGASESRFPTGWSTRDFARDAVAVLDAAGVDAAILIGHSMGGRIAQWVAADYPERVSAVVLSSTSIGEPSGVPRAQEVGTTLLAGASANILPLFVTPAWLAANPHEAAGLLSEAADAPVRRAHFGASATHDGSTAVPHITAPALVIHGEDDQICPVENATILAERIADARLHIVSLGRHKFLHEFPESLQAVVDFLDELTAAAGVTGDVGSGDDAGRGCRPNR